MIDLSREQINEMLCELYSPSVSMPEAPKQNFFAKLFASNAMIDPDQLCKLLFSIFFSRIKPFVFFSW
jgi:hypothetical protein